MKNPSKIHNRIFNLTFQDLQNKSFDALYASLLEEIGELAEYAVYGNTYKKPDEGIKGESVDVYICCVALLYAVIIGAKPTKEAHEKSLPILDSIVSGFIRTSLSQKSSKEKVFTHLRELTRSVSDLHYFNSTGTSGANYAIMIYNLTDGGIAEFWEIMDTKLDKWEKSQNGKLENLEIKSEVDQN